MKSHKKSFKILISSLLTVGLLANIPAWTPNVVEAAKKKSKHRGSNQGHAEAAGNQDNSHSDSDSSDTDTDRQHHSSNGDQNAAREAQERPWKQFLGEQNEEKGEYFKTLPPFTLKVWQKENVQVTFVDESTGNEGESLGEAPVHIRKKTTPEGSDVIVTKDHRSFTEEDTENFRRAVSEFTVDKQAEAGTLFTRGLIDALNGMKAAAGRQGEQGRALLQFTPSLENHEGRFNLQFLQAHLSDVKKVVTEAIALSADSTLQIYAQPMWQYVKGELSEELATPDGQASSGQENADKPASKDSSKSRDEDLKDRKEQDGNKQQSDSDQSDKKDSDKAPEVDRLVKEMVQVYTMAEDDATEFFGNIKSSLKIGWENKVLKKLLDDGWKIEAIDRSVYGVEGYERGTRDYFGLLTDLDMPYVVLPEKKKFITDLDLKMNQE